MTKEQEARWDMLRDRKKTCDIETTEFEKELRDDPDHPDRKMILEEIAFEKQLRGNISKLIPD